MLKSLANFVLHASRTNENISGRPNDCLPNCLCNTQNTFRPTSNIISQNTTMYDPFEMEETFSSSINFISWKFCFSLCSFFIEFHVEKTKARTATHTSDYTRTDTVTNGSCHTFTSTKAVTVLYSNKSLEVVLAQN